jgi:hypothetical protein
MMLKRFDNTRPDTMNTTSGKIVLKPPSEEEG